MDWIEPKIRPLVEALSSWEGIETYSSCEGHDTGLGRIPYVTFDCDNSQTIYEISKRLRNTSWNIVLDDKASGGGQVHYTLRYVSPSLFPEVSLNEIQVEIPQIADLLQIENSKPVEIVNKFPTHKCESCGSEEFMLEGLFLTLNLSYHHSLRLPEFIADLELNLCPDISFYCDECREELQLEDPNSVLIDLLNKASRLQGEIVWQY